VSNKVQTDDLKNQIDFLRTYTNASGIIIDEIISDTGSGLNYKRKKRNKNNRCTQRKKHLKKKNQQRI